MSSLILDSSVSACARARVCARTPMFIIHVHVYEENTREGNPSQLLVYPIIFLQIVASIAPM